MKEWICQEEPLIREDGASVGVGFRQMVELVRCKDCKKRYKKSCGYYYADGRIMCDDWFCADGERKSADEKLMEEMDADPLG